MLAKASRLELTQASVDLS